MKKKLLMLLLSTSMVFSVMACGATSEDEDDTKSEKDKDDSSKDKKNKKDKDEEEEVDICEEEGHDFEEATCQAPKTCKVCGETEGEPLEHEWGLRTVDSAKTCSICGETDGEPISVAKVDLSDKDGYVGIGREGYSVNVYNSNEGIFDYKVYTFAGDMVADGEIEYYQDNKLIFASVIYDWLDDQWYISAHNLANVAEKSSNTIMTLDGEEVWHSDKYNKYYFNGWSYANGEHYLWMCDGKSNDRKGYINRETGEEVKDLPTEEEKFESGDWKVYDDSTYTDYIFASNSDGNWGFLDKDFNLLAEYADVSDFTSSGYALASDDRETYYIIDTDFNKVSDNIYEGTSSYLIGDGKNGLDVNGIRITGDGIDYVLTIE